MDTNPIILIDTSYCCFYRYHALCNWYKLAHPEEQLDECNIGENTTFMDKFHKKFVDMIKEFKKLYSTSNMIMALDGRNNWRKHLYKEYKANRKNSSSKIGDCYIFQYLQSVIIPDLYQQFNIPSILVEEAEGDDVISVVKKNIRNQYPEKQIIIITSDTDLCQLIDDFTFIRDLKKKLLNDNLTKENLVAKDYLELKCIMGDKSDNIPPVFPKCGKKTAQKYLNNPDLLKEHLVKNEIWKENYQLNKTLIDLDNIPLPIQTCILEHYNNIGVSM